MRNKVMKRELFPLPLRPQIPIFSPGAMCKLTSLRTGVPSGVYAAEKCLVWISPLDGQLSGTVWISLSRFSHGVSSENVFNREISPMLVSRSVHCLTIHESDCPKPMTFNNANPTYPGPTVCLNLTTSTMSRMASTLTMRSTTRLSHLCIRKIR